ncbi:MAG: Mrp/NBP35 family ATP-binding protein [Parachlamydiaceae bacterium]
MPLQMFQKKERQPERPHSKKIAHVVAVAAGKGGVGKSTVTVNLALALRLAGYSVGIMDTDIYGPSIRKMLPEDEMPVQKGEMITPALCNGIRMISMAYFRKENEATAVRAPIANGLIHQFVHNVDWGYLDFLLIDFPPGTGDVQLTLSQQASLSGAVMVTTPQEVAVLDVRKAVSLFDLVNVPIIGIVENMSHYQENATSEKVYIFGRGGGERLAQEIGVPFLGAIPVDPTISRCGDAGTSLFSEEGDWVPAASAFTELAEALVAHTTALQRQAGETMTSFELNWKEMT